MRLLERFFKTFTAKEICDAKKSTEVLVCLSCASRSKVDDLVVKTVAAGGSTPRIENGPYCAGVIWHVDNPPVDTVP